MQNQTPIQLIYDRQCPACHYYCRIVSIRDEFGDLQLINARDNPDIMQTITERGLDIDEGMVLVTGEQLYYGADAIHALSLLSTRSGFFNRLNFWVFRSKTVSRFLYPVLRSMRNLLLKCLGKTRINNLDIDGNQRF